MDFDFANATQYTSLCTVQRYTGNISDPYLISNVKEFKEIENVEGDEYTYIYFRLVNDMIQQERSRKEGWKPLVFSYKLVNLMEIIVKLSMD